MKNYLKCFVLIFMIASCGATSKVDKSDKVQNSLSNITPDSVNDNTCIDVVFEIINSNSQCKEIVQNLKRSNVRYGYFVMASPNPQRDYADSLSEDYEIILFESHPEYNHNFAMYQFSPQTNKLYKMDVIEGEFVEADFDVQLISKFQKICSN